MGQNGSLFIKIDFNTETKISIYKKQDETVSNVPIQLNNHMQKQFYNYGNCVS